MCPTIECLSLPSAAKQCRLHLRRWCGLYWFILLLFCLLSADAINEFMLIWWLSDVERVHMCVDLVSDRRRKPKLIYIFIDIGCWSALRAVCDWLLRCILWVNTHKHKQTYHRSLLLNYRLNSVAPNRPYKGPINNIIHSGRPQLPQHNYIHFPLLRNIYVYIYTIYHPSLLPFI